ncbi:oxidoreductase [Paraburkholderia sediminicola]|uniref:oxidoreductase n=1 Tax=Paraburkholderia sediminicola TaxID=458836 RepID=UPI0038B936B0
MRTPQVPIGSGFNSASTAAEVIRGIDLTGKTAIVTGGYSGLGRETARELRAAGARVIVPARDVHRAAAALTGIDVEIEAMDLLDPLAIDAFAQRFLASGHPVHILVNSAGIMANPLTRDARGYESQFATNHLGHFQLTVGLWPALIKANGARVVSVSSWGHHFSSVVFDDANFERRNYDPWTAYGQSKTANILFAVALDELGKRDGVRVFSVHPGSVPGTGLQAHISVEEQKAAGVLDDWGNPIHDPSQNIKTIQQGAATSIWCATSPQLDGTGGVYCENSDIAVLSREGAPLSLQDSSKQSGVLPYAIDPDAAERLWDLSEKLLGLEKHAECP